MKKIILFLLFLMVQTVLFAQEHEYIPFVEEGKAWICRDDYGIYGSLTGGDVIFTMTSDTEINGKTYKKVYLQFPGYFGDEEQHYHCAVREEDCRVFVVDRRDS